MKALEICQKIVAEKSALCVRPTKGVPGEYDAKPWVGSKRGWVAIDLFSASAFVSVHAALKPENQKKLESMDLIRGLKVALSMCESD